MEPDARHDHRGELHLHGALIADAQRAADTLMGARRRMHALDADSTISLGAALEARDLHRAMPGLERSERETAAALEAFGCIDALWPRVGSASEVIA